MKKIITILVLAASATVYGQSFSVYRINPNNGAYTETITSGYILPDGTSAGNTESSMLLIKNNSAATITLNVTRTILVQTPLLSVDGSTAVPRTYFCFGTLVFSVT